VTLICTRGSFKFHQRPYKCLFEVEESLKVHGAVCLIVMPPDSESDEEWPSFYDGVAHVEGDNSSSYVDVLAFIETSDTDKDPNDKRIRVKEVQICNSFDLAHQKPNPRKINIKKYTTLLLVVGPQTPPYIGMVLKIWMLPNARLMPADQQPADGKTRRFRMEDFQLEMLWFYRMGEALQHVEDIRRLDRSKLSGASFRKQKEESSERQLLFSSHATFFDDDAEGKTDPNEYGVPLESVLHECKIHWLLEDDPDPVQLMLVGNRLVKRRAPGFYVRYFHHHGHRKAYSLSEQWPDEETRVIADKMIKKYKKEARELQRANDQVRQQFQQLKLKQQQAGTGGQGPASRGAADPMDEG